MAFADAYAGRRVLVTGHTGFKGAWLAEWLTTLGAEVTGYALEAPTTPSLFEALGLERRIRHVLADVRDPERLAAEMRVGSPSVIFHLAAQAVVRTAYAQPRETFETNVMGTVNVLEAARTCESVEAVVVVTSDKSYQNLETGRPFRETDAMGGRDPYSASKGAAELVVEAYRQSYFPAGAAVASVSGRQRHRPRRLGGRPDRPGHRPRADRRRAGGGAQSRRHPPLAARPRAAVGLPQPRGAAARRWPPLRRALELRPD